MMTNDAITFSCRIISLHD